MGADGVLEWRPDGYPSGYPSGCPNRVPEWMRPNERGGAGDQLFHYFTFALGEGPGGNTNKKTNERPGRPAMPRRLVCGWWCVRGEEKMKPGAALVRPGARLRSRHEAPLPVRERTNCNNLKG